MSVEPSKEKVVTPPATQSGDPTTGADGKQRRRNRNRRGNPRENRFDGACSELKGHTYDVVFGDTFAKTTREIAEYVARSYDDAGDFRTGMVDLQLPAIQPPADPDVDDQLAVEKWKLELRSYQKSKETRTRNQNRVFALLLGQCSQALRNRMEPHEDWVTINNDSDVIALLRLIQTCMSHKQTRRDTDHAAVEADIAIYRFTQNNLPDNVYYEKFKDLLQTTESLGSEIGCQHDRIYAQLKKIAVDLDNPTDEETETARLQAKDRYLGILFLVNSDQRRYGSLIRDIENQHTRGTNGYPDTLSVAYDYLVNFRRERKHVGNDDGGLAFFADEDNERNERTPRKKTPGRGNQGRGRGDGGRGGCDGRRKTGRVRIKEPENN